MTQYGREIIYTNEEEINSSNVVKVVQDALTVHLKNAASIRYLHRYYKGRQPVLDRVRAYRNELTQRIVENRAKQIVDFKAGYLVGEPIQYVSVNTDENADTISKYVSMLNDYGRVIDKPAKDLRIATWQFICGTAFRLVLPEKREGKVSPYRTIVLDPQTTFVIRSSKVEHTPLAGVYYVQDDAGNKKFSVYTPSKYFEIDGGKLTADEENTVGLIPIIEYPANDDRLGAFEPVLPLLDALNDLDSDRLEGVDQFIQSLLVLYNCDLEEGVTADTIKAAGMIKLKTVGENKADIKEISSQLNQAQTQSLKNDITGAINEICALPNRNGGSSTSDTGLAVVYRDGWSAAETSAKASEMMFKQSEREALNVILKICSSLGVFSLNPTDIDSHFSRRNYENIEVKANVLNLLLNNKQVDPRYAYQVCGLFVDSEEAYRAGMAYFESLPQEEE